MAATQLHALLRHLRGLLRTEGDGGLLDAELLERYAKQRDQAAFEVLLWRHGPMVLRVCRRLLRNEQDIEDAFQATFLALVRKAGSIAKREAVSSWLYKVAFRVALDARKLSARLAVHEKTVATLPVVQSPQDVAREVAQGELYSHLDTEIQRLPRKYRDPVVLCHLEGRTQEEAARELGWAKGTVSTRLIHARELLRRRLRHYGEVFPATTLLPPLANRTLPAKMAQLTLRAMHSVQSSTGADYLISVKVLALAEGAQRAVALGLWKTLAALLLILASLGTGAGWLAYRGARNSVGDGISGQVVPQFQEMDKATDRQLRSVLSKLDRSRIPVEDRFPWQPPELVSVLGEHRGRSWGGSVRSVAISPDGKLVAGCGGDTVVRLWDAATLREYAALKQHTDKVHCVAFSPEGKMLAWGSADRTVVLWDRTVGLPRVQAILDVSPDVVYTIAFTPDGSTLAAGCFKGVRLWSVTANRKPEDLSLLPQAQVNSLAFSDNGKTLAAGSSDGNVVLWDILAGQQRTLPKSSFPFQLHAVALSPNGKMLARTGDAVDFFKRRSKADRGAKNLEPQRYPVALWDLTNLDHPSETVIVSRPTWYASTVKFSPDGKTLAAGNYDGSLRLWNVSGGHLTERALIETSYYAISSLDFSRDGKTLVAGHGSGMVTLWDLTTPVPRERFTHHGHQATVYNVALAGTDLLASASSDGTLRLWDLTGSQGKERFCLKGPVSLYRFALSRDGKTLAFANDEGALEIWHLGKDKPTQRLLWSPKAKENSFGCSVVQISPDGKVLVTSGPDHVVRFWDLTSEPPQERSRFQGFAVSESVTFNREGSHASIPSDETSSTGLDFALWQSGPVAHITDVTAGPTSLRAAREDWNHVCIVSFPRNDPGSSAEGRKAKVLTDPLHLKAGERLPTKSVRLESPESGSRGERRARGRGFREMPPAILSGAISPDGQTLASAARDGKVILWEVATEAKYREWQLPGAVHGVAFADDGRHLITANANGTIYVLRLGLGVRAPTDLSVLWQTLATGNAAQAYPAIWSLVDTPRRTLAFFQEHLQPVKIIPEKEIERLIARLDSDKYQERARASAALEEMREQAKPALRRRLTEQPLTLELRQRIERILNESKPVSPEQLRARRAIQIVEQIGNRDAQELLRHLAHGAPQAPQTQQAQAALKRLAERLALQDGPHARLGA